MYDEYFHLHIVMKKVKHRKDLKLLACPTNTLIYQSFTDRIKVK